MKITLKNKELSLSTPAVMGILNVTPDSFFDGGKNTDEKSILSHSEKMLIEGADIIDIGAYSTRPNAQDISEEEELTRLIPAIKMVRAKFPKAIISADTFRANVAHRAALEGADLINDISGGTMDPEMFELLGHLRIPYVLTHIKGTPSTMQDNPQYQDVVKEVKHFLAEKINALKNIGVHQIILDPGFGFEKSIDHNYKLLQNLATFTEFELPILAGISRKGMIYKALDTNAEGALNGTTVANTIALMNGANLLRVHDVKEAKEAIKIFNFAKK